MKEQMLFVTTWRCSPVAAGPESRAMASIYFLAAGRLPMRAKDTPVAPLSAATGVFGRP